MREVSVDVSGRHKVYIFKIEDTDTLVLAYQTKRGQNPKDGNVNTLQFNDASCNQCNVNSGDEYRAVWKGNNWREKIKSRHWSENR